MSHLKTAIRIFNKLLDNGQLDRETEGDLFLEYRDPEVRSILAEFEEEMEFTIVDASSVIYLVPDSGNGLLGFTTKDMRGWIASDARLVDAYLLCYISMCILYLFYGGRNRNPKQRDFLGFNTVIEELDSRFAMALDDSEQAAVLEERHAVNFAKIAELWESKQGFVEGARKTRSGTVLNVCRRLEREGLLRIADDDREIRTTRKLDDLMMNYYLNDSRVGEIIELFAGGGVDAQD
ncbi:MAG: DUF6063 family protein [Syntrophaceticus sp.]|nr:DUF6063 family protein [Syntrophaceticus sp.]MDD3314812.1 DUF6063 family protein [Syntrophaceticus sp.]